MILKRFLNLWDKVWFAPVSPSPICVLRIFYGILCVVDGLLFMPDFLVWFGPHGVLTAATVRMSGSHPSLMVYHSFSEAETLAVLWCFLFFSVLVTIGLWTRLSMFMCWMLFVGFNARNPLMFHQVDNILRLIGFCLLFAPAGAMYSLDHWLACRNGVSAQPLLYAPWAQRLIQLQVVCIYFKAFWAKMLGSTWRDGTAVYYAVHCTAKHPVPGFLDNVLFYKIATYYTLLVEGSMWTLIWVQPLTKLVLLAVTCLHLGIDWFINLDLLEWSVISTYVVFLKPREVESIMAAITNFLRKIFTRKVADATDS